VRARWGGGGVAGVRVSSRGSGPAPGFYRAKTRVTERTRLKARTAHRGTIGAVSYAKKARENMQASRALMVQGFPNAAASRMYYALYLAAVHALEKQGHKPSAFQDEPGYWRHEIIRNNASLVRQRRGKDRMKDSALYNAVFEMRVTADYDAASVETDQLLGRIDDVQSLVEDVT
jgi:uncharacterized protein (UPF0332 family)